MTHASQNLEKQGVSFRGKRNIHSNGNKVYVRFTNIHDACAVFSNARLVGLDWCVDFVRPELWQVGQSLLLYMWVGANTVYSLLTPVRTQAWVTKVKSYLLYTSRHTASSVLQRLKPLCTASSTPRQRFLHLRSSLDLPIALFGS